MSFLVMVGREAENGLEGLPQNSRAAPGPGQGGPPGPVFPDGNAFLCRRPATIGGCLPGGHLAPRTSSWAGVGEEGAKRWGRGPPPPLLGLNRRG